MNIIALFMIAATLTTIFLGISTSFPYYYIWDLDNIVQQDLVLMANNLLPSHINHPSFGLYLILGTIQRLIDPYPTIANLNNYLIPIWGIAERLQWIRLCSPLLILSIIAILTTALRKIFNLGTTHTILLLLVLGVQSSFYFHSSLVRTELFSIFFWTLALLLLFYHSNKTFLVVVSGVLLGLSFFTKIQVFFYLLGIIPLLKFLSLEMVPSNQRKDKFLTATNILISLAAMIPAYLIVIQPGYATFTNNYSLNVFGILYLAMLLSLALLAWFKPKFHSRFLSLLLLGFHLSFLTHYLLYTDLAVSSKYLLYDIKMLLIRRSPFSQIGGLVAYLKNFLSLLQYYPLEWLVMIGALLALPPKKKVMGGILVLVNVAIFSVGARSYLRDTLWMEIFLTLTILVFLFTLTKRTSIIAVVTLACIISGGLRSSNMLSHSKLCYNIYGFDKDQLFKSPYPVASPFYPDLFKTFVEARPPAIIHELFDRAGDLRRLLFDARFILYNAKLGVQDLSILLTSMPINRKDREETIQSFSPELTGALLIDRDSFLLESKNDLIDPLINDPEEVISKQTKTKTQKLIIVPRRDLKTLLFFQNGKPTFAEAECELLSTPQYDFKTNYRTFHAYQPTKLCRIDPSLSGYFISISLM